MNITTNFALALSFILIITQSYPTCQPIQIDGYEYDLSRLPQNYEWFKMQKSQSTVDFYFCLPTNKNNVSSFVFVSQSGSIPYASANNPMKDNYTMMDKETPKKGIKINYLPYYDSTNQVYRNVTLNLYCPTSFITTNKICKRVNQNTTHTSIECDYLSEAGCASIKLNYFWQFLSDKAIIFAILLWIIALFQLLFGYLAIRMTIFIFGILSGAIFGIIYTAENYVNFIYESQGYGIAVFVICLSVLMGILFGIALLTLPRLGYINIGMWVAFIFSLLLQNSVLYLTGGLLAFYITVGVVGFIMAAIALMKLKNYIILSTSFISAFWLVRPLGFFLPYYPNQFLSGNSYLLNGSTNWQFYLYLISIIILTILGAVFQFCCFKKSASGNEAYYLEEEGSLKEKFKKLLEFEEVRHFIRSGADELRFFKQLIVDQSEESQHVTHHNKNNKKSVHETEEDEKSLGDNFSQEEKPVTRKKTKIQKQLQDYNSKKTKKQDQKKKQALFPTKSKPKHQEQQKRNRKVVQVPVQEQESEQQNKQSEDEQSQDVKPNKLTTYKRQGR